MNRSSLIESIPVIILSCISIITIYQVIMNALSLENKHYLGIGLVVLSLFFFIVKRSYYNYIFLLTLLLGFTDLINISFFEFYIKFRGLPLKILWFPLILYFLLTCEESFILKIKQMLAKSEEAYFDETQSAVIGFKMRFNKLSDVEIISRLNHKLTPEAREALSQIKEERNI